MSKFNSGRIRTPVSSPLVSEQAPSGRTHEGAPGYKRDAKTELFLLAVSNMVAEDSFYESAHARDNRYGELVRKLAVEDPQWTASMLRFLRSKANMRSASIVGAVEFAVARLRAGEHGYSRQVVDAVCQRADEPGELAAYYGANHRRVGAMPIKRGLADAAVRLYNEFSYIKWDSDARAFRFADVIELAHPSAKDARQNALFRHILDVRHGHAEEIAEELGVLRERQALLALPKEQRRAWLAQPELLGRAGFTWENLAGWLQGPMDSQAWEAIIPNMGYMALLRNLRNFDQAGVSNSVAEQIAAKLADPEQVAKSRQLPMRFLSAYKAVQNSLRWSWALEKALNLSLANVPELKGRTLILVDRSGSMFGGMSQRSQLSLADTAAIFGTALALRAQNADLVQFGSGSAPVSFNRSDSLLPILNRFTGMGGTQTAAAVRAHFRDHDRVIIVTDEQAWGGWRGEEPLKQIPAKVPVYTWNLAGYQHGHGVSGSGNRHLMGGLSDASFGLIGLLEAGKHANWDQLFGDIEPLTPPAAKASAQTRV